MSRENRVSLAETEFYTVVLDDFDLYGVEEVFSNGAKVTRGYVVINNEYGNGELFASTLPEAMFGMVNLTVAMRQKHWEFIEKNAQDVEPIEVLPDGTPVE